MMNVSVKKLACIFALPLLFGSCKNYLDIVPESDVMSTETIFEQESQVDEWVATCYSWINSLGNVLDIPYTGADELASSLYLRQYNPGGRFEGLLLGDGEQSVMSPLGDDWTNTGYYAAIRYCNTFFDHIADTYNMLEEDKIEWTAEVKAVKALYYFELVRKYGPIILLPENLDVAGSISDMKRPRSHVDTCFKEIVRLLDEAAADLPLKADKDLSRMGYFTKEAALALKAKVLVYQASPLFNGCPYYAGFLNSKGEPLFSTEVDKEKWRRAAEACDSVVRICEENGWALTTGNTGSTNLRNIMMDIEQSVQMPNYESTEILFQAKSGASSSDYYKCFYGYTLPLFASTDLSDRNDLLTGCLAPSMKMVEMYYTDKGLPIDRDKDWFYAGRYQMGRETDMATYNGVVPPSTDVLNLHLRREPRFYACIAADRTYWMRGGESKNLLVTAHRGEKFGLQTDQLLGNEPQNQYGYWLKKHSFSDVGTSNYTSAVTAKGENPFPLLRLAELYLMQAEAWNEYLEQPDERVYEPIDKVRKRAGIPGVVEAWTNYSTNPSMVRTQEGMREIIRRETNIELAFEGVRFWNVRRWMIAHEELTEPQYGWNVLGDTEEEFYNYYKGPIVVWSKRSFEAPRDYFFPIRSEEVQVSGVVQNLGW